MPGLAIQAPTNNDSGYASSSTSTLAAADEVPEIEEQLGKLSTTFPAATARPPSPSRVFTTGWSFSQVNPPHSTSRIPLSAFPSCNNSAPSPFSTPPILLRVGGAASLSPETEPVLFFAHEALLTRASGFFRSALRKSSMTAAVVGGGRDCGGGGYGFLEAETRAIDLPEDRPDDIKLFLRWLYYGVGVGIFPAKAATTPSSSSSSSSCPHTTTFNDSLSSLLLGRRTTRLLERHREYRIQRKEYNTSLKILAAKQHDGNLDEILPPAPPPPNRPPPPSFGPLIRLYVLADKYAMGLGLKDGIVDCVRHVAGETNSVPRKEDINLLYESSVAGRGWGLKKLILDLYVGMRTGKVLAEDCDDGGEDGDGEEIYWDEGFLVGLVEGWRGECERARNAAGGGEKDGKGEGEGGEYVKIGNLVGRRRCDYHDHEW